MLGIKKFSTSSGSTGYICHIKHNVVIRFFCFLFYRLFPKYLKTSGKKQHYRYISVVLLKYFSSCIFILRKSFLTLSFSHSGGKTICASLAASEKVLLGVDIEYIVDSIRPSLLNYIIKYQIYHDDESFIKILTIAMFSCMESIYKALSGFTAEAFAIELFEPIEITSTYCEFYMKLTHDHKVVARAIYFIDGKRIISLCCLNRNIDSLL